MTQARVLIAEDDPELRRVLQRGLAEEGFAPETVATGAELLARVESDPPDLLVVDIGLPDADGRDIFDNLRARWPSLPVIFSTGHAETRGLGGEAERVRVLQKPYEIAALLQAIADVTKESS